MGYVLKQGWHWQWVYRAGGLWMLLLAGILAFPKKQPQIHKRPMIDKSFFSLIREKNLLLLVLITLFGCGTYNGVSLWLVSFLKEIRSFPIFQASLGLSLFSTGLAIGRLLSGWLSSKIGNTRVLLLLSFLSLALLLFLLTTGSTTILGICFMAGLGSSGLYPVALALAGINFPQKSGTTIGILGTSAGIGNMFVPWLMSVASQGSSLKGGFLIGHFTALIALGLVSLYYRRLNNSEAK
jgi:fucose permease